MPKPKITLDIKQQADAIVARFNTEQLQGKSWAHYVTNYRGRICTWDANRADGLRRSAG